jgi:hypothetical protein
LVNQPNYSTGREEDNPSEARIFGRERQEWLPQVAKRIEGALDIPVRDLALADQLLEVSGLGAHPTYAPAVIVAAEPVGVLAAGRSLGGMGV